MRLTLRMPRLRTLSSTEIVKILTRFGFKIAYQKGSHIQLQNNAIIEKRITVPNHKFVPKGTIQAIYKKALESVPEDELRPYFYTQ
jgi:predicted RNA binding protein YcfA (HicA-like mRNA interferase family)